MALDEGVTKQGTKANVNEDYRARLMYYLSCVNSCFEIDEIPASRLKRLVDYGRFSLNIGELEELVSLCIKLSPYRLKDKSFFLDIKLCKMGKNTFYDTENNVNLSVPQNAYVSGKMRRFKGVMACSEKWIDEYWETPLKSAIGAFKGYSEQI